MSWSTMVASVGDRVSLSSHIGTIVYVGPVAGTSGTWLGVEWDDPSRGKHDGVHNGVRYFTCRVPGAGSFIRPTVAGLSYGRSFMEALLDKYVEDTPRAPATNEQPVKETVVLGSSHGLIEVEAVGLDKVRERLRKIDRLRDVSLDAELVASAGREGEIREKCPNLRSLDLSKNLIPSWDVVVMILQQLEYLDTLSLNQNRFRPLTQPFNSTTLPSLTSLQLNETLLTWQEACFLSPLFPNLQHLQFAYNRLSTLDVVPESVLGFRQLSELNLEGNMLQDWPNVLRSLERLPKLERLILASNKFELLPLPPQDSQPLLKTLRYLSLAGNSIKSWSFIDALDAWLPHLAGLSIVETALLETEDTKTSRALLVARLRSLTLLNGTSVSPGERSDSERFYLAHIVRTEPGRSEEERRKQHPRWAELCAKHSTPDAAPLPSSKPDVLASRLVNLNLAQLPAPPTPSSLPPTDCATANGRLLPSMTLKAVRMKVLKTLKLPVKGKVALWACSRSDDPGVGWIVEEMEGETNTMETWALRDGDWIIAVPE